MRTTLSYMIFSYGVLALSLLAYGVYSLSHEAWYVIAECVAAIIAGVVIAAVLVRLFAPDDFVRRA